MVSLWYCCVCSFGPHNSALYVECISCATRRCSGCKGDDNPEPQATFSIRSSSLSNKSQEYTFEDKALDISERPNWNDDELDWQKPTPASGPVPNPPTPRRQVQEGSVDGAILPSIVQTANQKSVGKSSETSPESLGRDSGYASASRPATLTVSSEIAFRPNIEPPIPGTLNETRLGYDHELQSLASDNEDISSQVSGDSNNQEKMASQALIRVFLAEEPHFRDLCEKAMVQMSRERFVENIRRFLKFFHKNLSAEAETEAEKAVARIMRSRRGRQRISQQLAVHILEEQGEGLKSDRVDLQIAPKDKNRVETWLAQTFEIPPGSRGVEAQGTNIAYSTSGSDDSSEASEFPYISEMKTFMRKARSFQVLLREFMIMFFPSDLRGVLLSIPKKNIWVSQEQDLSLLNRAKGWIEDQTQARWNWWPLKPRKRLLKASESRMFWQCTCGAQQWQEITTEQHAFVEKILVLSDDRPQSRYDCGTKKVVTTTPTWLNEDTSQKSHSSPPSTTESIAAQRYTPPGSNTSGSLLGRRSSTGNNNHPATTVPTQPNQTNPISIQNIQTNLTVPTVQYQSWILFGVQGAQRTLTPAQVLVHDYSTDYSVFEDIKKCYRMHRGLLRLWFSIWQMENCEVVKFNRLSLKRMVREYRDLPDHQDYQYKPRAGAIDAKNPFRLIYLRLYSTLVAPLAPGQFLMTVCFPRTVQGL